MKKYFFPLALLVMATISLDFSHHPINRKQTINPLLGDISFISRFGYQPDENTKEVLRIRTHLEFVEYFLRNKVVPGINHAQQQKRTNLLNLLHQYHEAGIFPGNYDYADQRKPCFIDKNRKICAVGYLIEQTSGREIAEQINNQFKYDELMTMDNVFLDNWIEQSGLTKVECAMIQPTYGPGPGEPANHITTSYGIVSGLFGGTNIVSGIINSLQLSKSAKNKTVPILGLATGITQVLIGALGMPPRIVIDGQTNESKRTLSYVNIGAGATSVILSAVNLVINKKPGSEKKVSWGLYSYPIPGNNLGMAFSLTKRI